MFGSKKPEMIGPHDAMPGREDPLPIPDRHHVTGRPISPPWPEGHELAVFGMGCFWGAERIYWSMEGVWTTFVGYAGGFTPNPTYREVCTGATGHAEVAGVVYDPDVVGYEQLLMEFWEQHDPTQYMGQGNDIGTQYRSTILTTSERQQAIAESSRDHYQQRLAAAGETGTITTRIAPIGEIYWAEAEHQQYLAKHPGGYCNHGFCQVAYSA